MNYYLKHFISYVDINVLSTIIFTIFLKVKEYPGGAVGMAPFLIIINCVVAVFLTFVLLTILKFKLNLNLLKSTILFSIVYSISMMFYFGANPLEERTDEMSWNVDLWSFISEFISFALFNLGIQISKKFAK